MTAKTTKANTVKAKNKVNKAPKKASKTASVGSVAVRGPPYTTTMNPDSCNCKNQV